MKTNFHFIFGLSDNFNNKPFCYFHYLSLKSCFLTQNNPIIKIHCLFEPQNNYWWDQIKDFCIIIKYKKLPDLIYFCNNKKVWRIEHQSDILRLLILKEEGGVYADIDTFFYKPIFPKFDNKEFVIGKEAYYENSEIKYITGLCNALLIANPNAQFIDIWLDYYKKDYDDYDWNKLSVRTPLELSLKYENLLHVEPIETFHKFGWCGNLYKKNILNGDEGIITKHLVESKMYEFLITLDSENIKKQNSLFSYMCSNVKGLL